MNVSGRMRPSISLYPGPNPYILTGEFTGMSTHAALQAGRFGRPLAQPGWVAQHNLRFTIGDRNELPGSGVSDCPVFVTCEDGVRNGGPNSSDAKIMGRLMIVSAVRRIRDSHG